MPLRESLLSEKLSRADRVYVALASLFVVVLVLTNIVGVKLFDAFAGSMPNGIFGNPMTLTSGIVTYPITFLLTDVVSEFWGKRRANFMVIIGFFASLLMLAIVQFTVWLDGSEVWVNGDLGYATVGEMQTAFESVFTLPGTLVLGSMTAYLVAQLLDVRLYHFWRQRTKGRHLWLRNNGSTWISQLVDTIIVNSIFLGFGLGLPWPVVGEIIVTVYIFKVLIAALDTPLIYASVAFLKRYLRVDAAGTWAGPDAQASAAEISS